MTDEIVLSVKAYPDGTGSIQPVAFGFSDTRNLLLEFGLTPEDNISIHLVTDVPFETSAEVIEAAEMLEIIAEQLRSTEFQTAWSEQNKDNN